jgi:apolipoprotein N-acyltransferase
MRRRTKKQVLFDFYIFGLVLCGFANTFLFQMSPENWNIGLNGWITVVARSIAWVLVCSFSALAYVVLGLALMRIESFQNKLLLLPLLFPAVELLRSYMFAAMAYGPKSNFSPNFNWGSLAVPGSGTFLVYNSRVLGFFGITIVVILINIALFFLLQRRFFAGMQILCIVLLCTAIGWRQGEQTYQSRKIRVSVVHLSELDDMKDSRDLNSLPEQTNILVLPEYSGIDKNPDPTPFLKSLTNGGVAITSIVNGKSPKGTNRIIYISRSNTIIDKQDKTFLIPTGELLPYSLQFSFKSIGKSWVNESFKYTQQLERGDKPEHVFTSKDGISIGTLACSGVSALAEYRRLANEGADVLVNTASLAFLQPNSFYHAYARNMARFQAVSNNLPFAQASRSGQSYILDNQGNTLVESNGQSKQVLSAIVGIK